MAPLLRVKARWGGFQGSPGYSVFHFRDFSDETFTTEQATGVAALTRDFFQNVSLVLPSTVNVAVQSDVEMIDHETGDLLDVLTAATPDLVNGAAPAGPFAAPTGAVVTWRTSTVKNNRRMRGRTFLVPLAGSAFEVNGTLLGTTVDRLNTAAATFRANTTFPQLGVYARPPVGGTGLFAPVTGHSVPDMAAILSSRRD